MTTEQVVTETYPNFAVRARIGGYMEVVADRTDPNTAVVGIGDNHLDALTDAAARLTTY